ncbi:MAG: N-formylglutamate amidohydrolase [Hydrocarboniphaga sp.]|uniref:N-formylglutamate amidohydrolase n=1 Tax=Hydrocarboniphaga sp. TaxID=2033016 RepID=UPI002627774A|nr:N-formylglutamate amidohydrolase [Hydrocarboniphaga sp.]MDB5971271.1 N-formylglutamate amidohydrolase [Hydrocarboniphaga sp.]
MSTIQTTTMHSSGGDATRLLAAGEPAALTVEREDGGSDFVFACDHAGHLIPRALGSLGLSETELSSHVAWDIGAAGVARVLAERLDATLVMQNYSQLVIDCNRPLTADDSIPGRSEWVQIEGNEHLLPEQIEARQSEIFAPYHDGLNAILDRRQRDRRRTVLITIASFTPTYRSSERPWQIGVAYGNDSRLAAIVLKLLRRDERLLVGDNEPYPIEDAVAYTLPQHGEARNLAHVGLLIRQDLIADETGQKTWAGRFASLLKQAGGMLDSH